MGYDRGDNFPLDFEPNGIPFVSKSIGKLSPRSYPIQCERKWKHIFLSAGRAAVRGIGETASLGIMGAPRVPPLNPSETIVF